MACGQEYHIKTADFNQQISPLHILYQMAKIDFFKSWKRTGQEPMQPVVNQRKW
uniref:Uncharacterized protein n=1 Tax=Arion vulgaris TaxID=1028688 RepID=A0A0B7B168_9EUPU